MPNYNQAHAFYCGVDLHARSMFVHILSARGKTVFERDLPAEPEAFLDAIDPFRQDLVVGCECMFAEPDLSLTMSGMTSVISTSMRPWRPDDRVQTN